jgi:hypothetical protein
LLADRDAASLKRSDLSAGSLLEALMAVGSVSHRWIPSVDPEIEKAADDVLRDPDAYFERERELCARQAEEYVGRELARAFSLRRRVGVRASLARLSHG